MVIAEVRVDAVLFVGGGDLACCRLHRLRRIAHGDARACIAEHLEVVVVVAERERIARLEAEMLQHDLDAARLVDGSIHDLEQVRRRAHDIERREQRLEFPLSPLAVRRLHHEQDLVRQGALSQAVREGAPLGHGSRDLHLQGDARVARVLDVPVMAGVVVDGRLGEVHLDCLEEGCRVLRLHRQAVERLSLFRQHERTAVRDQRDLDAHRLSDRVDGLRHARRDEYKGNPLLHEALDGLLRLFGDALVIRQQRAVDVREYNPCHANPS